MIEYVFLVLIIFATLAGLYWDYQTYHKQYRAILIILSGLCLGGYILNPSIWPSSKPAKIALLTDGSEIESFSPSGYEQVFSLKTSPDEFTGTYRWLPVINSLEFAAPSGSNVDIFGYGTDGYLPGNFTWNNRLNEPVTGIIIEDTPHVVESGHPFSIKIRLHNHKSGDSLSVFRDGIYLISKEPDTDGRITIQDQIFTEGPVQYDLEWQNGNDLITEAWHLRVNPSKQLHIAYLLYSPSFEVNYLVRHLGERGHRISGRTRMGDDRFRFDDLNSLNNDSQNIPEILDDVDLLILDINEFHKLTASERNMTKEALSEGLDIVLVSPLPGGLDNYLEGIEQLSGVQIRAQVMNRIENRVWFPGYLHSEIPGIDAIPLRDITFTWDSDQVTPLHSTDNGEVISLKIHSGDGSISLHRFYDSYRWILGGKTELYNQFWTEYISEAVTLESSFIETGDRIAYKNRKLVLTTNGDEPLIITSLRNGNEFQVPLSVGYGHPGVNYGYFWPGQNGWHKAANSDITTWFYVYDDEWKFDRDYKTYRNTLHQVENKPKIQDNVYRTHYSKIPDWVWLAVFLLFQISLWAERKIIS